MKHVKRILKNFELPSSTNYQSLFTEYDVNLDQFFISGYNILHQSILDEDYELCNFIITINESCKTKTPDLNIKDKTRLERTPLILLTLLNSSESLKIIQIMLQKGADPNISSKDGKTALHIASEQGNRDVVELLLKNGANINAKSDRGSALHFALDSDNNETILFLLKSGIDLTIRDDDDSTVLHLVCSLQNEVQFDYVYDHICKSNYQSEILNSTNISDQDTPLHIACKSDFMYAVTKINNNEFLKQKLKNKEGLTPYEILESNKIKKNMVLDNKKTNKKKLNKELNENENEEIKEPNNLQEDRKSVGFVPPVIDPESDLIVQKRKQQIFVTALIIGIFLGFYMFFDIYIKSLHK